MRTPSGPVRNPCATFGSLFGSQVRPAAFHFADDRGEVFDVEPEVIEHRSVGAAGRILFPQQDVDTRNLHHRELLSLHDLTADAGPEAHLGIDVHGIDMDVAERSARGIGTRQLRKRRRGHRERGENEQNSCFHERTLYQGRARHDTARRVTMPAKRSIDVLRDKSLYKSIAFTREERLRLGLQGLLPYAVSDAGATGLSRDARPQDAATRYRSIHDARLDPGAQRAVVLPDDHGALEETLPWIYTPTVGEACLQFSHIVREPKGFFITPDDKGRSRAFSTIGPRRTSESSSSLMASGCLASAIWAPTGWAFRSASSRSTRPAREFRRSIACRC